MTPVTATPASAPDALAVAASGALTPCPHCHAIARVEANPELLWRCSVCGGPRIPSSGSTATGPTSELARLVKAHREHGAASFWNVASMALSFAAAVGIVLALLLFSLSGIASAVVGGGALGALFGVMRARRNRASHRNEMRTALDEAWLSAARHVLANGGHAFHASQLADALGIDSAYAETLLTRLSVTDDVRVRIGDDSDIEYETTGATEADADTKAAR